MLAIETIAHALLVLEVWVLLAALGFSFSWSAPLIVEGGVKKTARYRYNFMVRRTPVSANDYTNVFSLVDAASSHGTAWRRSSTTSAVPGESP